MIALENLLNIICTEAFEYGGIPEVPDHKHGAPQNYHSWKRDARGPDYAEERTQDRESPVLQYNLRLVRAPDGTIDWAE
jgi:hypothetical protein